jgi:flagellar FliJ protein
MKWAKSLIRISNHEVETLQKRLADIVARRWAIKAQIDAIEAELSAEAQAAVSNAEAGLYLIGFREGAKLRRERLEAGLRELDAEELGARDALTEAFEALKKYENVVETARVVARKEEGRRETAMLDELGLRKRA